MKRALLCAFIMVLLTMGTGLITRAMAQGCADCPPGAIQESEPICSPGFVDTNPGCLGGGLAAFTTIPYSDTGTALCGSLGPSDWDAYRVVLPTQTVVRVCMVAEVPTQIIMGSLSEIGGTYCNFSASGSGAACLSYCVEANIPAGPAWLQLRPTDGVCGSRYVVTISYTPVRTDVVADSMWVSTAACEGTRVAHPVPGQSYNLNFSWHNAGSVVATGHRVELRLNGVLQCFDDNVSAATGPSCCQAAVVWPVGSVTLEGCVDVGNRVAETDEGNNCASRTYVSYKVVLNEIDYDQPSTDASEFIELKNNDVVAVNLGTFAVQLVNGLNGGAAVYQTIQLPSAMLAPGGYYVVCANPSTVSNCDLDVTPETNLIQNGPPDAVALLADGVILDTVSYEGNSGTPYTEGSGVGVVDDGTLPNVGISRYPDGVDTNVNNVDWSTRCITPGRANTLRNSSCDTPIAVNSTQWGTVKSLYR